MKNRSSLASYKGKPLSATCINMMARFVQVARQQEGKAVHLQDKNILTKISDIAAQTDNQQLLMLHQRLCDELQIVQSARLNTNNIQGVVHKSAVSSKLKDWGRGLK